MTMAAMSYEGSVECPDCELLRCLVYIPKGKDIVGLPSQSAFVIYECMQCGASWTLDDRWGDIPAPTEETKGP
jgi:hypothetical protein